MKDRSANGHGSPATFRLSNIGPGEGGHAWPRRVPPRYVMIGKKTTPYLAKQRVSGDAALPNVAHQGITIHRLVGSRLRFSWLKGDRT